MSSSLNNIFSFSFIIISVGTAILSASASNLPVPGRQPSKHILPVSSSKVKNTISSNGLIPSNTKLSVRLPVPLSNTIPHESLNGCVARCNSTLSFTLDIGLLLILISLECIIALWLFPPIPCADSDAIIPLPVSPVAVSYSIPSPAFVDEPSVPSNTILASWSPIPTAVLCDILMCSSNSVSNVEASSGENVVVSPS